MVATGLIVTVNTKGVPVLHNNVLGVIVYVAYCVELVGFIKAALVILTAAVPLSPPVNPPVTIGGFHV
jgi:hypothetical protein